MSIDNCNDYLRAMKRAYPRTCAVCGIGKCDYQDMGNGLARGVSIILYRGGRFAVSRRLTSLRHPGLWQFAGGHVEDGETVLAGAVRELREETGLDLPESRFELIGVTGPLRGYDGTMYVGHRYGVVLNDDEEPAHTEPEKHTPWEWVRPSALLGMEMLQASKEYALVFAIERGR